MINATQGYCGSRNGRDLGSPLPLGMDTKEASYSIKGIQGGPGLNPRQVGEHMGQAQVIGKASSELE